MARGSLGGLPSLPEPDARIMERASDDSNMAFLGDSGLRRAAVQSNTPEFISINDGYVSQNGFGLLLDENGIVVRICEFLFTRDSQDELSALIKALLERNHAAP